jgi:hypothetical protein
MATVTYKKQPGVHKTRGAIPLDGTSHVYTVSAVLWPEAVENWISERLVGSTLHVCCGKSRLGDVRVDLYEPDVDVKADAAKLPFDDNSFDTVLIDPPYTGKFQWSHDMLNELHRIARKRIIFQHHFSPVDKNGYFKKNHAFVLTDAAVVPTMPNNLASEIRLAVKTDEGYVIVDGDQGEKTFYLSDIVYWQPRTYFGRAQLISVLDRLIENEPTDNLGYQQLVFPFMLDK